MTALQKARSLTAPEACTKRHGDSEHWEWWEAHEELLAEAWDEFGKGPTPDLYDFHHSHLHDSVREAVVRGDLAALRLQLTEIIPGVFSFRLFSEIFCDQLLAEMDRLNAAGIPMRRPNGMNRFGAILSQLGFQQGLLAGLRRYVVCPLARVLYPDWIGGKECEECYGFTVRYKLGEDLELAEHSDTSNCTLNVCLGRQFTGGNLYFKGVRMTDTAKQKERLEVPHELGVALLHLGGHIHGALPLESGERTNLILWSTMEGGRIRVVKREPKEPSCCDQAGSTA